MYEKVLQLPRREFKFEKREVLPETKEEIKLPQDAANCYICGKRMFAESKNYRKFRDHCHYIGSYRAVAQSICNLRFNEPNKIPAFFHNGSNYDYHFIIKELGNKSEGQFECVRENTENCKTFFLPIEKEEKNG